MSAPAWLKEVGGLLLPGRCTGCGDRLPLGPEPRLVCATCASRLRAPPPPRCGRCDFPLGTGRAGRHGCLACRDWPAIIRRVRAAVLLEPPADALVHALKYEGWRGLALPLAARMAREAPPLAHEGRPPVVPVPTTPRRRRRRGYNQARLLAAEYARLLDLPLLDALERREGSGTQVSLHPDQRRANVAGAFRAPDPPGGPGPGSVRGCHVVLVDDVLTTGATVLAAGSALERAGASGVTVVAFARAVPRRS